MSGKLQEKTIGELTVTVKADVQDALKGIKALNGELELRETTQIVNLPPLKWEASWKT